MESDQEGFGPHGSSLRDLPRLRAGARLRSSSWDTTGGNEDWIVVGPAQTASLLEAEGAGNINHIWIGIPDAVGYRSAQPESRNADALQRLIL
jgi:hypothetical protein